jgi:homoserine kinase type II
MAVAHQATAPVTVIMNADQNSEIKAILKYYDLGELVECERNDRGYVNTSYAIEVMAGGSIHKYFLRRYKKGIKKEDIDFEHSLINHLLDKKFAPVAGIIKTRAGGTYVHRLEDERDKEGVYYAIFEFLNGEDRYTWVSPVCQSEELISAAQVLAQYHHTVYGFLPQGKRSEASIQTLLSELASLVAGARDRTKNTLFDACLIEHAPIILENIAETLSAVNEPDCKAGARLVIHCDYHPGNLKFSGSRATGLFDFDWSKLDLRCFDVGLALFYFFTGWGEQDGVLRLEDVALFLVAYQNALQNLPGVGPLSPGELKYLPHMIHAANLYVLNWTILDYYAKDVDPQEYLVYLQHGVNLIRWLARPESGIKLEQMLLSVQESGPPEISG